MQRNAELVRRRKALKGEPSLGSRLISPAEMQQVKNSMKAMDGVQSSPTVKEIEVLIKDVHVTTLQANLKLKQRQIKYQFRPRMASNYTVSKKNRGSSDF